MFARRGHFKSRATHSPSTGLDNCRHFKTASFATITPYQSLPLFLPCPITQPLTLGIRNLFFPDHAKYTRRSLICHLPTFSMSSYSCHHISSTHHKSVVLSRVDTSTAAHVHQIQALGIELIEIAVLQALENIKEVPYAPIPHCIQIYLTHSSWPMVLLLTSGSHRWNSPLVHSY